MITIKDAIDKFLQWGSIRYQYYTIRNYRLWLSKFSEYMKNKNIQDITVDDFIGYSHHLSVGKYSESYIAYHMIALRQMWKFLYMNRDVGLTYELINVPRYSQNSFIPAGYEDAKQIILAIDKDGEGFKQMRDKCIIAMLYATGMRVSELCDLTIGSFHLADRYATIKNKKNAKYRMVFWDEMTEVLLLTYLEEREMRALDEYVFINVDRNSNNTYTKMTTRSVQRLIKTYRQKAGIERPITPHSWRHGLATDCVKQGQHPRHTQKIMGHQNMNSSQVYMDVSDMDLKREYDKIALSRKS